MKIIDKTERQLELPYDLLTAAAGDSVFKLRLRSIDRDQNKDVVAACGLSARFDVVMLTLGIDAEMVTSLTAGNVYKFKKEFEACLQKGYGTAILKDYMRVPETELICMTGKSGECRVEGNIRTVRSGGSFEGGISFAAHCSPEIFLSLKERLDVMFSAFIAAQGHNTFI